ncbi:hypothetical protein A2799_03220 [Candidatus Roizmanbacteria bacterium RIFCSPHIGHO2_01_FULL_39_24]|uniref:MtN3 and saliva related transmembrane protein n=1 Tax=Candidatus Roizmanbacteria bacterium RIFCSPHIGHO2_01_FULL_39_24 TaxID=1802032 RepID=A0A1F7GEU1_9BACT|nr:MAG: hypothetical protein A2799_03220 [Candidatus Roizmanbacteria bacterium RIFCSPHIGHO2_01_FULL_39_24]
MLPNVTFAAIIGALTIAIGIIVKVIGFPDQFRINYKRKSTKGLSTLFYILAFISYILWTTHGVLQNDPVLIIGQGVGIITTGMIVAQIIIYRKNK